MLIGQTVESPEGMNDAVSGLVTELFDRHDEALFMGVTRANPPGKSKITIYSKAPARGGTLYPYLTALLQELVSRHEQTSQRAARQPSKPL